LSTQKFINVTFLTVVAIITSTFLEAYWNGAVLPAPQERQAHSEALAANLQEGVAAAADPAKGKAIFESTCSFCHVADSNEAVLGPGLKDLFNWPPHQLSDGTEHTSHTEEIIRKQILEGGGAMQPAGADLSEDDLANLIAYLKTL
jgi:cytochrome c5